jgi:hypothetical protein
VEHPSSGSATSSVRQTDQAAQPAAAFVGPLEALAAGIERLDELGLRDELGRVAVEPAATFRAS